MYRWKLASACVIGNGHALYNLPCQDKTYTLKNEVFKSITVKKQKTKSIAKKYQKKILDKINSFYGLSLADGAGSCKNSDIGAEFISKEILLFIEKNFDFLYKSNTIQIDLTNHIETVLIKMTDDNISFKDLSSTLLFVTIKSNKFIIGHIGDGLIGMLDNSDNIKIVSKPDNGEFSNATYFTTSTSYPNRLRLLKGNLKNSKGFILMSDGSEESLYNKQTETLAEINKTLINWLKYNNEKDVENALINSLEQVIRKKTQDDCSVGIMRING